MSTLHKVLIALASVAVVGGGTAYLYITRPVSAPSAPIEQQTPTPSGDANTFRIVQQGSEVSFTLNEVLRGEPTVVVGTTNQVAGDISLNPEQPSAATVSTIRVNARSLATDSPQRNGAISRLILESEKAEYEFIEFAPTKVEGLPSRVTVGTAFNVRITGTLKIRAISKEVTFVGTATLASNDQLTADVSTIVKRGDYNLIIPNIPFVANVQEEVTLRAKLNAVRAGAEIQADVIPQNGGLIEDEEEDISANEDEDLSDDLKGGVDVNVDVDAGVSVGTNVQQVTVVADSHLTFSPKTLKVKKGQKVRLVFQNTGGRHDFVIDELGVSTNLLQAGESQTVEFTPTKTGTFEYYCSVGNHRAMGMTGMITVE